MPASPGRGSQAGKLASWLCQLLAASPAAWLRSKPAQQADFRVLLPQKMRIVTDRLVLREFVSGDWPAVQTYLADQRYWRYYEPLTSDTSANMPGGSSPDMPGGSSPDLPGDPPEAIADTSSHDAPDGSPGDTTDRQRLIDDFINWQAASPRRNFQLAITLSDPAGGKGSNAAAGGQLIGNAGLRLRRLFDFGRPEATFEADLGYELDPEYWGHGYATEAVAGLLEFGFGELDLHRVWAYCLAENQPSWRLLQRLGFRLEGTVRENEFMRGRWWDSQLYGLLASEWQPQQT